MSEYSDYFKILSEQYNFNEILKGSPDNYIAIDDDIIVKNPIRNIQHPTKESTKIEIIKYEDIKK